MFERDIYNQLQKWAERTGRKPLVLRGARQVGKTTLVNEFARNFENYLHLNLEREEDARLFQSTDKVQEIMKIACFQKNILLREGRTLLFIDEIQNSAKAVARLRYFYEQLPEIFVIAAGSLLENLVAVTLLRRYGTDDAVFFYNRNVEVDFYLPDTGVAIQVCYTMNLSDETFQREVQALVKLNKVFECRQLLIITYDDEERIELEKCAIEVIPVWKWLLGK